jgi:hypothetical protein
LLAAARGDARPVSRLQQAKCHRWSDRKGVELARPRDAGKAAALERWLREVETAFDGRVLGIDNAVSDQWGRMSAIRPVPVIDGLLAATASVNGLTLVTRNDRDVAGLGPMVLNPFKDAPNRHRS